MTEIIESLCFMSSVPGASNVWAVRCAPVHKEVQTQACGMKIAYPLRKPDGAAVCLRFMTCPQKMSVPKLVDGASAQVGQAIGNARQKTETRDAWMLGPLSGGGTFSWQA